MTASWRRRASAAAALVLVVLAVALAGVAWQEAESLEESERVRAMLRTLVAFEDELSSATVAQRDFLLTSSPVNHAEYRNRLLRAEQELSALRQLAQSQSGFSEEFAQLERAAQTAHTDLADAVARFSAGAPAAETLAASEIVSRTLHLAVHELEQRLRGELAENSAHLSTTLLYTLPGLLLVFAILAPLAAYGFVSARAELLAKRRNEHALKATNAELEARVRERTAELVEREARYRSLVADIPGSVYRCRNDRDFTMLVVSDGVQDLTGYPPSDFLERGRSFARLIDPEDADRVLDSLQCAVAQREPFELVYRIRHADGGIRWAHERGRGVYAGNGDLLFLDGIVFDVTVQHEAEARLHAVHRTLAESERRFRQMAETIDDVFWMATPDLQQLLYISPAIERVWGMRCSDLYENPRLWFESIHADDADRVREGLAAISAGIVCDAEWRIGRPDGEERWLHGRAFPVCEADGSVVLAAGIGVDITRRKAGEAELQAARRETEAALDVASRKNVLLYGALRTQAEFLGRVSHELKTPLNAVIGFSELLLSGFAGELPEEQRQHVQEIYVAGEQLLSRITDVLDLAGAQSGDTALTIESVDPDALVVQAVESLGSRARDGQVAVQVNAIHPPGKVAVDPAKVTGLLRQLIGNAIKFTPAGGQVDVTLEIVPRAAVPTSLEPAERYLAIRISDTGVGMVPDVLDRLFEPFEQGDGALNRAHGGLGIGLAIVRHVARLHGGDIATESRPGAGTTMKVWLPSRGEPKAVRPGLPPDVAVGATGRTALVIEDDPASAALLEKQLTGAGFAVVISSRGLDAIDLARAHRPALVLLDLILPDVDGWALLARWKHDPALEPIPVVIVSAVADRERGRASGAMAVIQKPCQFADIANVLATLSLESAS